MKISIITICFNNENDIEETLKSVICQTYYDIEYIVIDGDSKDGTLKIVNKYAKDITKIISEPDQGMYDAINKGIRLSTGNVVGLIHAGDRLFDKNIIQKIAEHFSKNDIDASYGHDIIVNSSGIPVRVNKSPRFKKSLFRFGWMPAHQSVYIRREVFDRLGYYRTDLGGSGDYEFVLRCFYFNDLKIKRLDEYVLKFSMGGRSTTNYRKRLIRSQRKHIRSWAMNGEKAPFYMVFCKLARKIPQFWRAFLLRYSNTYKD